MNCYNNNNNITTTKVQLNHDFQKPLFRNKVLAIFIAIFQFFAQAYRCIIKKFRADRVQPIPIDLNKLDVEYDEKAEVKFINEVYSIWNKTKPSLIQLLKILERNWNSSQVRKEKDYYN